MLIVFGLLKLEQIITYTLGNQKIMISTSTAHHNIKLLDIRETKYCENLG